MPLPLGYPASKWPGMDLNHHWKGLPSESENELQSCTILVHLCARHRNLWGLLREEVVEDLVAGLLVGDRGAVGFLTSELDGSGELVYTFEQFVGP